MAGTLESRLVSASSRYERATKPHCAAPAHDNPKQKAHSKMGFWIFSKTVLVCFVHFCPSPALPQPRLSAALEDFLKQSLGCHGFLLFALKSSVLNLDPHKGGYTTCSDKRTNPYCAGLLQAFLDSFGIVLYLVDSSSTRGGGNLNQSNNHTFVPVIKQLHSRS